MKAKKAKAPSAQIHDQGYERYEGPRLEQSRRFLIVARNVLTVAWRSRWGFKAPLVVGGLFVMALALRMYGAAQVSGIAAAGDPKLEQLPLRIVQESVPSMGLIGMIFAAVFGCSAVADDLKVGAFQFYFSRSLRTADYVIGKVLGITAILGIPFFVVPVLLALLRLALVEDTTQLGKVWTILPLAFVYGLLSSFVFAVPAIGLGAVFASRRMAQAAFVVYYVLVGFVASNIAHNTKATQVGLLNMLSNLVNVGGSLFGIEAPSTAPPAWQSLLALGGFCLLGLVGLMWRVSRAEVSSVGGGT